MPDVRKTANTKPGTFSLEKLSHFRCGECNKWWSIGDAPEREEWTCPWCGIKQSFSDKTPKNLSH